jgi:broad specificity phosphatase PhoE
VEGEEQARRLGRAIEMLGIAIGEVFSSPYARTMESAKLAFGRATRDALLYGGHSAEDLRERFNRAPRDGNTVLMTHQGILRSALGYRQPEEGDCIVLRPRADEGGPQVVANVTVEEWERLANASGQPRRL